MHSDTMASARNVYIINGERIYRTDWLFEERNL